MSQVADKLAGMRQLFTNPLKFFDEVSRRGSYLDGLIFLALLVLWVGAGVVGMDPALSPENKASTGLQFFGISFAVLLVVTTLWGFLAALIGSRLRPRVAAVLSFKDAVRRCLRVLIFALAPLALIFYPHPLTVGLAFLGVIALSIIGVAKALSLKILPALIMQVVIVAAIVSGAKGIRSLIVEPPVAEKRIEMPSNHMVGKLAPDILIQPTGGTAFRLSELKGKIVILDFWAIWCMPCRIGLPIVSEVASKYKDQGVVFYAVGEGNVNGEKRYLEQRNINAIPAVSNAEGYQAFNVSAIPLTIVIDKAGVIKHVQVGLSQNEKEELTSVIEAALQ